MIDRSNYVFYWPVAREAGRHFIVSRAKGTEGRGKKKEKKRKKKTPAANTTIVLLAEEMTDAVARRKQVMCGENGLQERAKEPRREGETHTHTHLQTCGVTLRMVSHSTKK